MEICRHYCRVVTYMFTRTTYRRGRSRINEICRADPRAGELRNLVAEFMLMLGVPDLVVAYLISARRKTPGA